MRSVERESFIKSFLLFFTLLEAILALLFLSLYRNAIQEYKQDLFKSMLLCSYTLDCDRFGYDFTPKKSQKSNDLTLSNTIYSIFPLPQSKKYDIKLSYPKKDYEADIQRIKRDKLTQFALLTLVLTLLSLLFTLYTLKPLRVALKLNDEFVKDILHDFNTPITSILLNINMFKEEHKENIFVKNISHSIDSLLLLQNNLKSFLTNSQKRNTTVNLYTLMSERVDFFRNIYPNILFELEGVKGAKIETDRDSLVRIVDNLLDNAAKYNKRGGEVTATIDKKGITIKDSGKGIKNPKAVFERYYKEQSRGIGLGLHIVKKLCDELDIGIYIESRIGVGTTVRLVFAKGGA